MVLLLAYRQELWKQKVCPYVCGESGWTFLQHESDETKPLKLVVRTWSLRRLKQQLVVAANCVCLALNTLCVSDWETSVFSLPGNFTHWRLCPADWGLAVWCQHVTHKRVRERVNPNMAREGVVLYLATDWRRVSPSARGNPAPSCGSSVL